MHPFLRKAILENWKIIEHQKTHNDNWAPQKPWNPYFYSANMTLAQLKNFDLAQLITLKMAKLGPINNFTACMYIYIYALWSYYLVQVWPFQGLLFGPRRGCYLVQVCF